MPVPPAMDATNRLVLQGKPWIPVNENYTQINVAAAENDPNSILHYYRKMIAYRKANSSWFGHFEDLLRNILICSFINVGTIKVLF